ncbi:hypothetical protein IAE33_001671 [Pseudomonas sp. S60]|nr:hypothetical protein [Pseudomonas sp. S36]MBK5009811.1 hypothetical protein [Pseudomonas sp. S60]
MIDHGNHAIIFDPSSNQRRATNLAETNAFAP